jgi:SAM-dependent methyltransferase
VSSEIDRKLRKVIAGLFPGRFPGLYSVLDAPASVVPVQVAAYQLATREYVHPGDRVLDVGFGLGYGLAIMAEKAGELTGIETDPRALSRAEALPASTPKIRALKRYGGRTIPYDARSFDVVTCVDVLEHVRDYMGLIAEMIRVSDRIVLLSTPSRRPENTRRNGRPRNRWHIREWSFEELDSILREFPDAHIDWNFLNGPWDGPFECGPAIHKDTLALAPALVRASSRR